MLGAVFYAGDDYLTSLNTLLQSAITDLKYDLGKV